MVMTGRLPDSLAARRSDIQAGINPFNKSGVGRVAMNWGAIPRPLVVVPDEPAECGDLLIIGLDRWPLKCNGRPAATA